MGSNYQKEHTAVTVLGVFAAIFFTICLTATLILLPISLNIKGLTSIETYTRDSDFSKDLTDLINAEIKAEVKDDFEKEGLKVPNEYISEDSMATLLEAIFGATFEDESIDASKITNDIKDDLKKCLKESGYDYSEYETELDEFCVEFEKELNSLSKELKSNSSDLAMLSEGLTALANAFKVLVIISLGMTIAFGILILIMYKKKFRALLNLGICGTVAGSIGLCISLFIGTFITTYTLAFKDSLDELNSEGLPFDSFIAKIVEKVSSISTSLLASTGICLLIGITLIVLACVIKSKYKKSLQYKSSATTYQGPEF